MKTIINNFMKFALIATFAFAGAVFADASFVNDPSTQGNGITSIGHGYGDANDNNSISISIPDEGDSEDFYVFIDYQNASSSTLNDVRARLTYSGSSSVSFTGYLSSSNGGSASDSASLTGLPDDYEITLVSATKVNTHGSYCGSQYEYNTSISGLMSSNGALIGSLSTEGESSTNGYSGACSQGHVVAKLRVTNTDAGSSNPGDVEVNTLAESNVTSTSAKLNGDLITGGPADHYWFVYSSSDHDPECTATPNDPNPSAGSVGTGSNPSYSVTQSGLISDTTYYYRACVTIDNEVYGGAVESFTTSDNGSSDGSSPEADTQTEDDVTETSASLKGRIKMNEVNNGVVFYVYGQDESKIENTESDYDSYDEATNNEDGDDFQVILADSDNDEDGWITYTKNVSGLDTDQMYYYQICVEYDDGSENIVCGGVESFVTDGDNNNDGVQIETTPYDDIGTTYATLCGDLEDNGGDSSLRTNIEVRPASGGSWDGSPFRQRGEGAYCVDVTGLTPNTRYQYRACTDDGDCGDVRTFLTNGGGQVLALNVNTLAPTNIRTSSATLNGKYQGSSLEPTRMWFEWGTTQSLGRQKQVFSRTAVGGNFSDSFTGLRNCATYYYRAVAQNSTGIVYGNIYQLTTGCTDNGVVVPKVVVVEEVEEQVIDLDSLGLGLSLLRLDIDDDQDSLFRDAIVEYVVRWENISTIDLDTIDLKIVIPEEITVTGTSNGRFDADENVVLYTIDRLDRGEEGSLSITGVVTNGKLGDVITAEATAAYNNPINDAQENATDYDIDDFVINTNFGTASVFGLSNITFLGWLTILLGLLIIFLIARWLYLEREELRAQAYANGYRPVLQDPRYGYDRRVIGSGYEAPRPIVEQTNYDQGPEDNYQPYRPNRG